MAIRTELLTPVGRLVQGSLYKGRGTDLEGRPLTVKTGANAGQPRTDFYFAIAIEKGSEQHWNQTEWGAKIWNAGLQGFPNGQANSPAFAWKVIDGDSAIPDREGHKPCDREGFKGCWIVKFKSGFACPIYDEFGIKQIIEPDFVKLGSYIQVFGNVSANESTQQPGVYINPQVVAFSRYGETITIGIDAKDVGFGKSAIPAGALSTPPAGRFNPTTNPQVAQPAPVAQSAPAVAAPPPYADILQPAAPVAPTEPRMTPAANGIPYSAYVEKGWTHQQLLDCGLLEM